MPTTEGKGLIAPTPKRVLLSSSDFALARSLVKQRMEFRRYGERSDEWGNGLIGTEKSLLVGFIGEIGFSLWVRDATGIYRPVDDCDRPYGDAGIDFMFEPWGIQVKTATTNYTDTLIRVHEASKFRWHILVRAQWPSFSDGETSVDLLGWVYADEFRKNAAISKERSGWNRSLADRYLNPMRDLADLLNSRKELAEGAR